MCRYYVTLRGIQVLKTFEENDVVRELPSAKPRISSLVRTAAVISRFAAKSLHKLSLGSRPVPGASCTLKQGYMVPNSGYLGHIRFRVNSLRKSGLISHRNFASKN